MLVTFKRTWFAPMQVGPANDRRSISGGRFRRGTQEVPDELRPYLPKDAKVIGEVTEASEPDQTMQDFDLERQAADVEVEASNRAVQQALDREEEQRQRRIENLKKAREAKAKKKAE